MENLNCCPKTATKIGYQFWDVVLSKNSMIADVIAMFLFGF